MKSFEFSIVSIGPGRSGVSCWATSPPSERSLKNACGKNGEKQRPRPGSLAVLVKHFEKQKEVNFGP